jgi:hypothetical protein
MLAFDIETTGLDPATCEITCAAVWGPEGGAQRAFVFPVGDSPEEFMRLLDAAPRLCCFNGVQFDIPFIQARWRVPGQRVAGWRLKVHDVFEGSRLCLGHTFSLDALLLANGLSSKTGSGAGAVELARTGQWAALASYCLDDARITHRVSSLRRIRLPKQCGLVMCADGRFELSPGRAGRP